jgi:phosphoribosylanthranilate isomerase
MRTRIKICGMTNLNDALSALKAGADALGFVFYKQSPRYIEPEIASEIIRNLPPLVTVVGVFVNEQIDKVREIASYCLLDILQFHGFESPEYCEWYHNRVIKAFRVKDASSMEEIKKYKGKVSGYLLDSYSEVAYGGTGSTFDWSVAREISRILPVVLAGGLTPDNVAQAVSEVQPYGVDVSSGVESAPGSKDMEKMRSFVESVRKADEDLYGMK